MQRKINIYFISEEILRKYGWMVLATPIAIHGINKVYELFSMVIEKGCNANIKYDKFEFSISK